MAVPALFIVAFPLAFISAFHSPAPNEVTMTVVGPQAVATEVADSLDKTKEFQVTHTDVVEEAESDVKDRRAVGSLLITMHEDPTQGPETITAYVGSGNGPSTVAVIRAAAEKVAGELDVPLTVKDIAPVATKDPMGSNLFYLLIYSTVGAFMLVIVLAETAPGTRARTMFAVVGVGSILIPPLVFGLSAFFVGDYGASFGAIASVLAVDALYVFTIGSIAILMHEFLGGSLLLGVLLLAIFFNVPSSGGPVPFALLPDFWQSIHSFSFGAGAMEAFRGLVYFDGHGVSRWILQLAAWAVAVPGAVAIVALSKSNHRMRNELTLMKRKARKRGVNVATVADATSSTGELMEGKVR
ncbi:ABC transporter permease [Microbacterium panaciterrae]|uniref:ABC transporter permease n=1 Tax=Microbacterium panaciterrae TaxID=985759 RepID=UPI0031F0442F